MIRNRLASLGLALALAASLPAATTAQEELTTPEGTAWSLTSYLASDGVDLVPVPFSVDATLRLEGGIASGSGGCNAFSGSYQIDGSTLRFSEEVTRTLQLCEADIQSVEDHYLSLLPDVASWSILDGVLELSDAFDDIVLTFEVPSIAWTPSKLTGLMAMLTGLQTQIDTLRSDMDGLNVDRLRERIKVLERDNVKLKDQVGQLEAGAKATPKPQSLAFSSAEKILLEGIPSRISSRCRPLRSTLPKGTKAAVTCTPNTSIIASADYYLLEGSDAATAFANTMSTFNVLEAVSEDKSCAFGVKSQRLGGIGSGWQSEGCYRTNNRAEVRFVDNATDCRQLKVGGKRLKSPAIYIALQGTNNDVAKVYAWATKGKGLGHGPGEITAITQFIKRPGEKLATYCVA